MEYALGIDVGSSSVKVSLLDLKTGRAAASASAPETEAPIAAPQKGWAEQAPDAWWDYLGQAIGRIGASCDLSSVRAIGISYQMHGLVAVDRAVRPLRDAIIWCDSRAVGIGAEAFAGIGEQRCLTHLLNAPGNFTASKLGWVRRHEPQIFDRIYKMMLPGDYIAYRLTGEVSTTASALSEGGLWDFKASRPAGFVADWFGFPESMLPDVAPALGVSGRTTSEIEKAWRIPAGTPVSYRAGDQPNNAFSLRVLRPGEIAATAGTSAVVYAVTDQLVTDPQQRVNNFLHVTPHEVPCLGVLLCINGSGIMNAWLRREICKDLSYDEMNDMAGTVPPGSDGVLVLPFGNGAERVLSLRASDARFIGIDLVRHKRAHLVRAVQEGIAFAMAYGIDVMRQMGLQMRVMRAGRANMFLSELFRKTLATVCDVDIELFDTDGSLGAARGAALGAGLYASEDEAFRSLECLSVTRPEASWRQPVQAAYRAWCEALEKSFIKQ